MSVIQSLVPLAVFLVPACAAPVLASAKSPNVREGWTFVAATVTFLLVASMVPAVLAGDVFQVTLAPFLPGAPIMLRVDPFGLLFALVSSSLWIVTTAYAVGYMRGLDEHSQTRFFAFFALSIASALGAAFSANLLTLYLFYECLSFATYPLVAHHQNQESLASGRKYLSYIVGTSIGLVLPAMLAVYFVTGTLDFDAPGRMAGLIGPEWSTVLMAMFLFGFAKAGIMPFHSWLPAAMVAPTPVSALLHAVAVVKVGAFSIFRVVTGVFGTDLLHSLNLGVFITTVAAATILIASLIALSQDGLKRRLAFSTIGQLSYIVLGAGLLVPRALEGGMLHIVMHAFGKITLFFCAGAIYVAAGKKYISQMDGIGRRMPLTMTAFFIGSLSIIGIPPTGGFYSKWYLLLGALDADQWPMVVVLLTSSLLNAAYFLPITYRAFFRPSADPDYDAGVREAPLFCVVPLCITALVSVALFFWPDVFLRLAALAAGQ